MVFPSEEATSVVDCSDQLTRVRKLSRIGVGLSLALLIGGCSVKSDPITTDEVNARIAADKASLFEGQEPISGSLGLGEAIIRSMRYNLDSRVKFMELAVATKQLDFSNQRGI